VNSITFHPALDVHHTEFRLLRLRRLMAADLPWHFDQLRICDFYLLFFFRLSDARLLRGHRWIKRHAIESASMRYEAQPDDDLLFSRMEQFQRAALGTLVAKGFLQVDQARLQYVREGDVPEPEELTQRIGALATKEQKKLEALSALVSDYSLLGPDGLKARTGLLEYRYDAV
jgi:hypothetical protein